MSYFIDNETFIREQGRLIALKKTLETQLAHEVKTNGFTRKAQEIQDNLNRTIREIG